jgi:para-aminobenzoate synthetase/4-amino-4-deoxychorismate lyase
LTVIVRDAASGKWRHFERPLAVFVASEVGDVLPALERVERECSLQYRHAAGFISYEAAPAFDSGLKTQEPDDFPLLWFGVFDAVSERTLDELEPAAGTTTDERWEPAISADQYSRIFAELKELIRDGDTYQVNYTYRQQARVAPYEGHGSAGSVVRTECRECKTPTRV